MLDSVLAFGDLGLLVLRLVLGMIFLVHGIPKIKNFPGVSQWLGSTGFKPGKFWALVLVVVEVVGGAFLVVGLATQLVAFAVAVEMLVAMWVGRKKGFVGGWEFELALFAIAIALLFLGGGQWSLGW